jgi:O-antigen ligase
MLGAYIVSIIGIVQIVSYMLGIGIGYDFKLLGLNKWGVQPGGYFGIRLNSIFSEPSYFGGSIGPAFFVSIYNLTRKKEVFISRNKSLIIIAAYLLTFSTVAYVGIFIVLILMLINFGFIRYVAVFVPLIIVSYIILYNNVQEFQDRIDGVTQLYEGTVEKSTDVHGSSFVQYNNIHIATENFKRNPFFGTGLGSHEMAYDKYSLADEFGGQNQFNKSDANSMFLRLMSETGLYGLILIIFFIIRNFVFKGNDTSESNYWIISNAVLVVIILQLFLQGNYTYNGFFFYLWMYFFTSKLSKKDAIEKLQIENTTDSSDFESQIKIESSDTK